MTSERKIAANRANAAFSTGPRSERGKATVALNPLRHGLFSAKTVLPNENRERFRALDEALRAALNPEGAQEELQVDLMVRALWKLRRADTVEASIHKYHRYGILAERVRKKAEDYDPRISEDKGDDGELEELISKDHLEKYRKLMARAKKMEALQEKTAATLGETFIQGLGALAAVSRSEVKSERSYYRALHELQALQRARLGGRVPRSSNAGELDRPIGALRPRPA